MCNHQPEWNLLNVVENLLDKVIAKGKSVDNYQTPQVLVMAQDTI